MKTCTRIMISGVLAFKQRHFGSTIYLSLVLLIVHIFVLRHLLKHGLDVPFSAAPRWAIQLNSMVSGIRECKGLMTKLISRKRHSPPIEFAVDKDLSCFCDITPTVVVCSRSALRNGLEMALALPATVQGMKPPSLTNKMMKMLPGYLKKQRGPLAQLASELQSSTIENTLGQEYGVSFHSRDRTNLSSECQKRPADLLMHAVKELKDVKAGSALEPEVVQDVFILAFVLMDVCNAVNQMQPCGELEFSTAQAILLQLVSYLSGSTLVAPGTYHVDERRVIRVVCWGSSLLAIPSYFGETLQVSEPREYLIFPKPDPARYRGSITVASVSGSGQEFLCEGAHIIISCVHPHIDLATTQQDIFTSLSRKAEVLLSWFIAAPSCEQIQRYLAAAERKQPVIFLRRNLGLTNPETPFHESSCVVFLDSEDDVEKVLQLADEVPCGLSRHFFDCQTGMIPFTFPPALDDWDQRMQDSMMHSGVPFADDLEAASYFCQKLEDVAVDLTQLQDEIEDIEIIDDDPIIAHAKRLARDALLCLQKHHVAVRWVSEILDEIIEQAAYQGRIKQEQERISRRWEEQPKVKQNRHAAKRERKKQGETRTEEVKTPVQLSAAQRLRGILNDFTNKVFKYQHYRKAFHALQSTGLLAHVGCESVHGSHHVLHASGARSATVVMPHGAASEHRRHRFARSLMSIAQARDVS